MFEQVEDEIKNLFANIGVGCIAITLQILEVNEMLREYKIALTSEVYNRLKELVIDKLQAGEQLDTKELFIRIKSEFPPNA